MAKQKSHFVSGKAGVLAESYFIPIINFFKLI